MGEIEDKDINELQIDIKGNSIETKLIDAVNSLAILVDNLPATNNERSRICSYAINRFKDLKESLASYRFEHGDH